MLTTGDIISNMSTVQWFLSNQKLKFSCKMSVSWICCDIDVYVDVTVARMSLIIEIYVVPVSLVLLSTAKQTEPWLLWYACITLRCCLRYSYTLVYTILWTAVTRYGLSNVSIDFPQIEMQLFTKMLLPLADSIQFLLCTVCPRVV